MYNISFILEYFKQLRKKISNRVFYERELHLQFLSEKATVILGPRRSGKSSLLQDFFKKNLNTTLYADLEHSAFETITHQDFFEIISLYESNFSLKVKTVLLDEIQNIKKWERLVRSLIDSGYQVVITGSSSKLISKEAATQMRGRCLTFLLLPLSFREYLKFKGITLETNISISAKTKILNELNTFIEWGGYPEVVISWEQREKILKEYFDSILYRDFIDYFNVSQPVIARFLFEYIFQNFSCELSLNKAANFVASRIGRKTKNIVYDYGEKLRETLSIFFLEKCTKGRYERKSSMRKVYICDVGLSNLLTFSKDTGKRMENTVYLELLRKTNAIPMLSVYYWKDRQQREVDFVVKERDKVVQLIQTTYATNKEEIHPREIRSLLKASNEFSSENLLVLTWDYEGSKEKDGKVIKFLPLWKWLIEEKNPFKK